MLSIRICDTNGALIAEGTCSDSGYFPIALASVYNAALKPVPARTIEGFGSGAGSADYPVGTRRVAFGYGSSSRGGIGRIFDDEVVVHVERT
jgi:hypothetical protein